MTLSILTLVLTGCTNAKGTFVAYDSVSTHISAATSALRNAAGLRVHGTVRDAARKNLAIDIRINGGGDALGLVTRNGVVGNVLTVDGSTYVRATAAWWAPDSRAESYDRVWVRAATTSVGLDFATKLRPRAVGAALADAIGDTPAIGTQAQIDGVSTQKIEADTDAFWLSVAAPYRVVRLDGPLLTGVDSRPVSLSVAALSPLATAETSRDVALLLPQLQGGSYDAAHALQFNGALHSTCDANGCTVTGGIRNLSTDTPVTGAFTGKVVNGKTILGRCRSANVPLAAASAANVSCRVATAGWKAFYAEATSPGAGMATTTYQVSASASALTPAPESLTCLPTGTGCTAPTLATTQVTKTFDRSAQAWYGRAVTGTDLPAWRTLIRTAAASSDHVPWSSLGAPTVAYLSASKGRPFVAQFARGSGNLISAYGPDDTETSALRQAIAGRR